MLFTKLCSLARQLEWKKMSFKTKDPLKQTGDSKLRSFATEGVIFWLVVVGAVEITAGATPGGFAGFVFAAVNLALAWLCWKRKKPALPFAITLAILTVVGAYPFPFRGVGDPFQAEIETLLIIGSLLVVLFGFRAYRETRLPQPNTREAEE